MQARCRRVYHFAQAELAALQGFVRPLIVESAQHRGDLFTELTRMRRSAMRVERPLVLPDLEDEELIRFRDALQDFKAGGAFLAARVGELLQQEGVETFVLVTSLPHMRRALGAFGDQGMEPIPSAAMHGTSVDSSGPAPFLPSAEALAESETTFREILALVYYRLRGWLG